ncbi:hypothetical protein BX667DRAFT_496142 [Coemansia mojavensis]|nr:hypothetical protein BX667DRAFT_496142 [Coemansia mojavensis]
MAEDIQEAPAIQAAVLPCEPHASGPRTTMHKHPFAPMVLDKEPTKDNVFRRPYNPHEHGTVRAFIGPKSTNWMQQHQRWWSRTASKMEGTGTTKKIRRRLSKHDTLADSPGELFTKKHHRRNFSTGSFSDSDDSIGISDWSSLSANSSDSDNVDTGLNDVTVHSQPEGPHATPTSEIMLRNSGPENATMPMPKLPSSPNDNVPNTAPAQTKSHLNNAPEPEAPKARRQSSLNTIKGLFRRHSTNRPKPRRSSDAVTRSRHSLDTIPSMSSAGNSTDLNLQRPSDRERASSTSHVPGAASPGAGQLAPSARVSLDASPTSPKLSSLRRIAVTRSSRSNTWQPQMEPKINQSELLSFGQADINLHLLRIMDKVDSPTSHSSSRIGKSRRAMVAKIKAYYKHQSQLSETTVILSTRAVVRRETATNDAFAEKYNEATCQKYRESTQEWAEMWVALTKRGIMFYLASKKHPTLAILFPPYTAIAPRISLFSTLDLSLAIMYHDRSASIQTSAKGKSEDSEAKDSLQVAIIKFPSAQVACQWYREIGQALLLGRVMFPSAFLNESMPAAQPPPSLVMVNVPELGIKVQVKLGRHNAQVPRNVLMGGSDDALLERQWRCETTTVWHIRQDVVNVLLKDSVVGKSICEWLEAERRGELTIGMAWRRCDRLEWIMPCGALDTNGNFKVDTVNDMVVGPQLLEGTHMLELRVLEHYPDIITTNSTCIYEPVGVEGFVMLKREQKHRVVSYKPALLTTHNGYLFFVDAPRAVRYLDASIHKCNSQPAVGEGVCDSDDGSQVVCYYHPDERSCSKQMSLAKYMLNITDIEQIVPLVHDYDDTPDSNGMATFLDGGLGLESVSENAEPTSQSTHRPKGKLLGFLRSKKARQSACKFRLVTRTGSSVVIWTPNEQCMREWVRRLTELRYYWTNRMIADYSLYSQTCLLNYSTQGHSSRIRDDMDWFDEGAWAERLVWNACLILGCRSIIKAGILYRKRHRHQGMRKVFCILTRGRLIEFKYPVAPLAPGQTMLAEYMIRNDPTMSHVFKDICDNNKSLGEAVSSADKSSPSLLFARSRSLSLRRCYVVSRFADDLSTHDIMCEPWVMTDIGNYNGLRLADRVYADGIVSHELINDCIFTVWRPTFVPPILRTSKAPHSLEDLSDQSADGQATQGSGADSRCSSPTPAGPDSNRSRAVSFSPPLVAVVPPAATESAVHQRSFSHDYGRQSIESQIEPAKASLDMPRLSGDGYNSSVSNASSVSSSRHDTSKPGAYRVGDEIHLNVDDKRNGKRRMSAIGMASSMRRRIGVYRARTNSEMAQWVTAINQEIRRMSLSGEW